MDLLPPAAAATPQQARLSLAGATSPAAPANTPASPALLGHTVGLRSEDERRSQPVPAAAVAQAIEAAAAEDGGAEEAALIRQLSLAEPEPEHVQQGAEEQPAEEQPARRTSFFSVPQAAEAAAAASPPAAAAVPLPAPEPAAEAAAAAAAAAAASPVLPTPYAATEYDGEDVVMMDVGEPLFVCGVVLAVSELGLAVCSPCTCQHSCSRGPSSSAQCVPVLICIWPLLLHPNPASRRLHALPHNRQAGARRQQPLPA